MIEDYEALREKYNGYSYDLLRSTANSLCVEVHNGKSFIEVFQTDSLSAEDLIEDIIKLHRRADLQEMNAKVIAEKEVLNKPAAYVQTELDIVPDNTTTLLDLWREKWNLRITHQEIPCDLYCLSFLSQLFKEITIYRGGTNEDIRLHVCIIMPSGTGKSDGNDILTEVCNHAGLTTYYLDRYTDAILTGSIDGKIVDLNMKRGYKEGDPQWQNPVRPSVLSLYNFIVYDEAQNILKTSMTTDGAQSHLQKAMNRRGSAANLLTNSLVGGTIQCYPDCNIIMTSYYLDEFKDTLLKRGLLQRMVVYIQEEDEAKRVSIINRIIDSVPSFEEDIKEAEEKQRQIEMKNARLDELIAAEIKSLKEYHKNTKHIFVKSEAKPVIKEVIMYLRELVPMQASEQAEIWNSMISRLTVNILKMSTLYAIMSYRTYIVESDIRKAADILIPTMDSVGFFLKTKFKHMQSAKTSAFYSSLKKSEKVGILMSEAEMIDYIVERFEISREKAKLTIDSLIQDKKITANVVGGIKRLKIVGSKA